MENITIEISKEQIFSSYAKAIEKVLNDSPYSYDSPIRKAVDATLKEKQLDINVMVNKIIDEVISSQAFKDKITDVVSYGILNDLNKLKK